MDRPKYLSGIEERIMEGKDNHLFPYQKFEEFRNHQGFVHGHRGTYPSERGDAFLYIKNGFQTDTQEKARSRLALLRFLTSKGIVSPNTRWGVFITKGVYQIFVISRKLDIPKGDALPQAGKQTIITWKLLEQEG